jgi:hypothetical protein
MQMLLDMHDSQKYPDMLTLTYKTLPKIGYIAYKDKMPIAAGFLRRLEPCYAQIDTLVSNAYCGSLLRHEGIQKVVDALISEAKRLKLQGIISFTKDSGTIQRAVDIGFRISPQAVIVLPLGDK